jgi:isopenicillin N synthase-like dioxygenase
VAIAASRRAQFNEIPIIDISELGRDTRAEAATVSAIRHACEDVGFFYATGHGIDSTRFDDIFAQCRRFFAIPQVERDALLLTNSPYYRGYLPIGARGDDIKRARDLLESLNVASELGPDDPDVRRGKPLHGPNQWPCLPGFRDAVLGYYASMDTLMRRLLQGFALALDLKRDGLDHQYRKPLTQMRLLHYPAQEGEIVDMIGARPHRDFGMFTILLQDDVGGLEVQNDSEEWVVAPPIPGTLIINFGNMMKTMTNDHFSAAVHRVINRYGKERYSVPFFINPDYDAVLAALPQFADPAKPVEKPVLAGELLHNFYRSLWPSVGKAII